MTTCASLLVSGWKLIYQWWAHVLMLCKSLLLWITVTFGSVTFENNDVSSAKFFGFEVRLSGRSLI